MRILKFKVDETDIFVPSSSISKLESIEEHFTLITCMSGKYKIPIETNSLISHIFIESVELNDIIFPIGYNNEDPEWPIHGGGHEKLGD